MTGHTHCRLLGLARDKSVMLGCMWSVKPKFGKFLHVGRDDGSIANVNLH